MKSLTPVLLPADPTEDLHAATKAYVDANVGGGASANAVGPIMITDTPAGSPLVFADLLQNEAGDDLLYEEP